MINFEQKKVKMHQSLSFCKAKAVVRKCSIKKVAHKNLSKFTCNLIKKGTPTQLYFCEFSKILKKHLAKHLQKAGSGFSHFFMSHSIIHFIKRNSKKGYYYFLNVFKRVSTSENYRQNKFLDSKMQLFVIFPSEELELKSFIREWDPA